jgi:DNA mismatch repair protein MSH5
MKKTYAGMESLLDEVAVNIASTVPGHLGIDINVIYFPQLGFNIAIPLDENGGATYAGGEEAWDQVFTTENRAYFKDFRMKEMDEKLGDMYGLICGKDSILHHMVLSDATKRRKSISFTSSPNIFLHSKSCL